MIVGECGFDTALTEEMRAEGDAIMAVLSCALHDGVNCSDFEAAPLPVVQEPHHR